jgi:hypothetical protein
MKMHMNLTHLFDFTTKSQSELLALNTFVRNNRNHAIDLKYGPEVQAPDKMYLTVQPALSEVTNSQPTTATNLQSVSRSKPPTEGCNSST